MQPIDLKRVDDCQIHPEAVARLLAVPHSAVAVVPVIVGRPATVAVVADAVAAPVVVAAAAVEDDDFRTPVVIDHLLRDLKSQRLHISVHL